MAELHHKSVESSVNYYGYYGTTSLPSNFGAFRTVKFASQWQSCVVQVHHVQPNDAGMWSLTDMRSNLRPHSCQPPLDCIMPCEPTQTSLKNRGILNQNCSCSLEIHASASHSLTTSGATGRCCVLKTSGGLQQSSVSFSMTVITLILLSITVSAFSASWHRLLVHDDTWAPGTSVSIHLGLTQRGQDPHPQSPSRIISSWPCFVCHFSLVCVWHT